MLRRLTTLLLTIALLAVPASPASAADPLVEGRFPVPGSFADQLYDDFLGREPDPGGLRVWTERLETSHAPAGVIRGFLESSELDGTMAAIVRLYFAEFGRLPDYDGLTHWLRLRRSGWTLEQISDAFVRSDEFQIRHGSLTDPEFIDLLYRHVLGRDPDPVGYSHWLGLLSSSQMTRGQVALAFSESPEHRSKVRDRVLITVLYLGMQRRSPDPVGYQHWLNQAGGGVSVEEVIDGFYRSAEYAARFPTAPSRLQIDTVASGLSIPWDVEMAQDGALFFTERSGGLSARLTDGTVRGLSGDFSDLWVSGETGLTGLALDADFASNRRLYTCQGHSSPREMQVIAWTVDAGYSQAVRVADPLVGGITAGSGRHGGCQLTIDPSTGLLWIGTGDGAIGSTPQNLQSLAGKVLVVDPATGGPAPGAPFGGAADPRTRLIWSYGHRNVQGLPASLDRGVWAIEHGPNVDDEVNNRLLGTNAGWDPVPGYNENVPMTDLVKFPDAVPAAWSSGPSRVAASGGDFLEGTAWGSWDGALATATLRDRRLRVLFFSDGGLYLGQVVPAQMDRTFGRLRAAMLGPDDALYMTTSNGSGADRILRITPG